MLFFHIFLTISATLAVSAAPLPVGHSTVISNSSSPYDHPSRGWPSYAAEQIHPLQDTDILFQMGGVPPHDYINSRAKIIDDFHKFSAENTVSAKMTKLAFVPKDWVHVDDRQFLEVHYLMGTRSYNPIVDGGVRMIYRDISPAKPLLLSCSRKVLGDEKRELTAHITNYYNALPDNSPYRRAAVTRVEQGWRPGGGNTDEIRDHVTFKSHYSLRHTDKNMIGEPHVIRRPLTVSFGKEVDEGSRDLIEEKVREQHESLGSNHIAKPSNVALVVGGSYKNAEGKNEAQVGYYEFPDCPKSQDERYIDHGRYPVALE